MPNLLSAQVSAPPSLQPEKSGKSIKVADGSTASTCEKLKGVLVSFADHAASLHFLFIENMPVDTIIGIPNLEQLEARINMGHHYVTMTIDGVDVQLSFEHQRENEFLQ